MKILYVGSKAIDHASLNLDREITEIQRRANSVSTSDVEFTFLPDVTIEDLPLELSVRRPDVLHFSAHGDTRALSFRRADGKDVTVRADALTAFLNPDSPPTLVYINACNSSQLAERLVETSVPLAIGSTAPITNRAARAGAVAFYDRLLSGFSVQEAHDAQQAIVGALEGARASVKLYARPGISPERVFLHQVPQIEVDFEESARVGKDEHYDFSLHLVGCPPSTTQVIFFTDDDDEDDADDECEFETNLTYVVRGTPLGQRRALTTYDDLPWRARGDFRLFAVGVTGDARMFTVATTLAAALTRRYKAGMPASVARVIRTLQLEDGSAPETTVTVRAGNGMEKSVRRSAKR